MNGSDAPGRRSLWLSVPGRSDRRGGRAGRFRVHRGEALPPARVAQRPAELALGLRIRGAARLGRKHGVDLAREQAREPEREVTRRLGPERVREDRQPLAPRGRLVVDDVVDRGAVVLEREHGRRGGVVEVDERDEPAAIADDRETRLAHQRGPAVVGRAIEPAVAKRDPAGGGDRLVEVAHCSERLAGRFRRGGVERVVLGLDHAALPRVAGGGEALGDETGYARLARSGEQVVGALRSELLVWAKG